MKNCTKAKNSQSERLFRSDSTNTHTRSRELKVEEQDRETMAATQKKEEQAQPLPPVEPVAGIDFGTQNLVTALGFDRERLPFIVPNNLGSLTTPFVPLPQRATAHPTER